LPPNGGKPAIAFPHGFYSWTVTGLTPEQTITVDMTFPSAMPIGTEYWKVIGGVWIDATFALGSDDGDNILTLTVTDGGPLDADGATNGEISDPGGAGTTEVAVQVDIDIRPNSDTNNINLKSKQLTVAILGSDEFDATTVDFFSVLFGPDGAQPIHKKAHSHEDVNGDGHLDTILHFDISDIGVTEDTTELCLVGQTTGGTQIEGCDTVIIKSKPKGGDKEGFDVILESSTQT